MTRQVSARHAAVTSKPFSRKRFRKVLHREIHELSSSSCLTFLVAARQGALCSHPVKLLKG
jgi:hypothetical protein